MAKVDLTAPEFYINRELSWLEFNERVLQEGLSDSVPLLERLKFLSIVSSNLDEFFMVRVAGLMRQRAAGTMGRDPSGLTPASQLEAIAGRARRMVAEQAAGIGRALTLLRPQGLAVLEREEWTAEQRKFLQAHYENEILPALTPLAIQELSPAPLLPGLTLFVAAVLEAKGLDVPWRIVVVPQPVQWARFLTVPAASGVNVVRLDSIIAAHLDLLFPGSKILGTGIFRITRDADVTFEDDDEAADLAVSIEEAVLARRRRAAVRLEVSADADTRIRQWLPEWLGLSEESVYEIQGMLDATALMELANRRGFDSLKAPEWAPQPPQDLLGADDLLEAMENRDILLFHPYERFDPVIQLLDLAAADPGVLAIKQTLYRTSGDSPIVRALERAARNGKQVTVLVELKARFDEARNVGWARQLEDAGCHVIYGVAGLKTHAKALLIVRRDAGRIRRYVHLSTGNYNDRTARLYSDIGLLTCRREMANDVASLFNLLTGASEATGWTSLTIAPTDLRQHFVEMIDREVQVSAADRSGLIMAKVNSLQDEGICQALYRASRAGVRVLLNVRGICCLRPGVKGVSDTIEVRSIVDRYLEHVRIFYFRNGGREEVYLSSADWMTRNLDRRVETLFPITAPAMVRRLVGILETCFADTVKSRRLLPDGTYEMVKGKSPGVRAQETFHTAAVEATRAMRAPATRFRPLTRPEE